MHLLNAAVAATSVIVGTAGATVAYGTLNTPPVQPRDVPEQVTVQEYAPCDPPAVLTGDTCVTTVVKTVVKKEKPKVITIVQTTHSPKGTSHSSTHRSKRDRHHDDDDHGEEEHDEGGHGGHGEDDD